MGNAFVGIQPDGSGKKVQTFENTVGGNVVEAQGMVPVDSTTGSAVAILSTPPVGNEYCIFTRVIPHATLPQLVSQGAAAALASAWPIKLTDGSNTAGLF